MPFDGMQTRMAQQIKVSLLDDVDGSEAVETVIFGLDGQVYEIDLSEGNAATLRGVLADYVNAGRLVGGRATRPRPARTPRAADPERTRDIRAWAQAQGLAVSARGRISGQLVRAYDERPSLQAPVSVITDAPVETPQAPRARVSPPVFSGM